MMADDMQAETEPKRRGRPPKDGPDRELREARDDTRTERGRRERVPLGAPQTKLSAKIPDNMVGRWVNDVPGRVEAALTAGYEFINDKGTTDDRESARTQIVGVKEDGSAMVGCLMAIPKEWYEEDQLAKQKPLDAFEEEINRGIPQGADAQKEQGAFYNHGTVIGRK